MVNTEFYKNAKIYKIVDNTNGNIYVGSTCKKLCQRMAQHRTSYKQYLNGKYHFVTSFKIIENGDYDIILLEEVKDCENKEQLRARERHYIESLDCINKVIVGRTKQEYYIDNRETILEYHKNYVLKNKAHLCRKLLCECGKYYTMEHKKRHEKTNIHQNYLRDVKELINIKST
jgi:hypothetical protein